VNVLRDENDYKEWSAGGVLALSPGPAPSSGAVEGGVANVAGIVDGHDAAAVALTATAGAVSYGDLRAQVDSLRGGLAGIGVAAGDRVALVSENDPVFVVAYLAVLGLGAVVVPLNPASPAAEIERELAAATPSVVIGGPGSSATLADLDRQRAGGRVTELVMSDPDGVGRAVALRELLDAAPVPRVEPAAGDLAVLMFTAGTSAAPRAAMLTHGNLRSNLEQLQRHPGRGLVPADVTLGVLPMCHIFGLNVVLGLSLFAGARIVLVDRFEPAATLQLVTAERVTVLAGAPTMYAAWAALPQASPDALGSVRLAVSGAAPLGGEVAAAFERRFGVVLREGYGLTEASPVVTSSPPDDRVRPGSVGVPLPGVEVRLVDDTGDDVLVGDEGEVWVRGPNVFAGYWNDEDATSQAITPDGWLRTGDVAVLGDDGELYLVDRRKDLIIVNGFNVYPAEVEDALLEHPAVGEVAVIGVHHDYSGEAVRAYVVVAPGAQVTEADLIAHAATRLARYKCPSEIAFVDSLPRGTAGKLLRRRLGDVESPNRPG
jgi:long-chain acyl-CoA synthetase